MTWRRRAAAATVGAVMLLTQTGPSAMAEVLPLDSAECHVAAEGTAAPRTSWHIERLQMDRVWHLATGEGVTVAVIDTAVASTGSMYMQEASDKRFTTYDLLEGKKSYDNQPIDEFDCLHGTRVTSLLAAGRTDDGKPVDERVEFSGIAPDAKVLTYRTLMQSVADENSEPEPLRPTTDAVLDAVERGVDVINISQVVPYGVDGFDGFEAAINLALSRGIVVVAAAGNTGQLGNAPAFPASFDGVISVGASNRFDAGDPVSQYGAKVDVGAPGAGLIALEPSNYDSTRGLQSQVYSQPISGTSYAAPIVSGVVALMIENQRTSGLERLSPAEIRQRLIETADPPSATVPDPRLGAGIINPMRALSGEVPQLQANPGADNEVPANTYPPKREIDERPAAIGMVMGVAALSLVALGIVGAIVIPAARRASGRNAHRPQ